MERYYNRLLAVQVYYRIKGEVKTEKVCAVLTCCPAWRGGSWRSPLPPRRTRRASAPGSGSWSTAAYSSCRCAAALNEWQFTENSAHERQQGAFRNHKGFVITQACKSTRNWRAMLLWELRSDETLLKLPPLSFPKGQQGTFEKHGRRNKQLKIRALVAANSELGAMQFAQRRFELFREDCELTRAIYFLPALRGRALQQPWP
jgi:hypothetical protein